MKRLNMRTIPLRIRQTGYETVRIRQTEYETVIIHHENRQLRNLNSKVEATQT